MSEEKKYTLKDLQDKLTEKEKNFCHEYCVDWNGARAARVAGYSKKSAKELGHRLLTKVHIKQYLDFVKYDYEFLCGISKTKQLKELHKIAYSSIAYLHNTWIELKEFESLTDDQRASIESIETKIEQRTVDKELLDIKLVKIKLYSKTTAITEINKMQGYYEAEKINISGGVTSLNLVKASESSASQD